uniref:Uncharacterized protein n=1 Tax=Anguilla anguilla TaxID=7936 RepID=A0A0E9VDG6_ANGAN
MSSYFSIHKKDCCPHH